MSGKVDRFGLMSADTFAGDYCIESVTMAATDDGEYVRHSDYAALEARCAGLEANDTRYRWLRNRGFGFAHDELRRGISTSRWGHWEFDTDEGFAMQCDAAIDAAIAKEREGK